MLCYNDHTQHSWRNKGYFIGTTKENWYDAKQECIQKGMQLIQVDSQEEHNFLIKILKGKKGKFGIFLVIFRKQFC